MYKSPLMRKIIAICVILVFLPSATPAPQENSPQALLKEALEHYSAGRYDAARVALEQIVNYWINTVGTKSAINGQVYLLLGATCEKLGLEENAKQYYAQAKQLLGEGVGIEGLDLKTLRLYAGVTGPAAGAPELKEKAEAATKKQGTKETSGAAAYRRHTQQKRFWKKAGIWLLGMLAVGGVVTYALLASRPKSKISTVYTSVTLKATFTLSAMNGSSDFSCWAGSPGKLSTLVAKGFFKMPAMDEQMALACGNARQVYTNESIINLGGDTLNLSQAYTNVVFAGDDQQVLICPSLTYLILSYTWESGKPDPGPPIIENSVDLSRSYVIDPANSLYGFSVNQNLRFIPNQQVNSGQTRSQR